MENKLVTGQFLEGKLCEENNSLISRKTSPVPAKKMKFSIDYLLQEAGPAEVSMENKVNPGFFKPQIADPNFLKQDQYLRCIKDFTPMTCNAEDRTCQGLEISGSKDEFDDQNWIKFPNFDIAKQTRGFKRASSVDSCQPHNVPTFENILEHSTDKLLSSTPGTATSVAVQRGKTSTTSAPTRKLGRNPRVPFTSGQVAILEQKYQVKQYLSSIDVAELSTLLSLNDSRVKIWFQNRRARARKEQQLNKALISEDCSPKNTSCGLSAPGSKTPTTQQHSFAISPVAAANAWNTPHSSNYPILDPNFKLKNNNSNNQPQKRVTELAPPNSESAMATSSALGNRRDPTTPHFLNFCAAGGLLRPALGAFANNTSRFQGICPGPQTPLMTTYANSVHSTFPSYSRLTTN